MTSLEPDCDTATERHTVLIVEDSPSLRDSYWAALLEAGFRGVATANAGNILDVMYAENVSVILLDLFKPDGIETLKAVKRVSPETLVVAMGEDRDRLDCLAMARELGADAFVSTPASAHAIVDAVKALTARDTVVSGAERRRYTRLEVDQPGYLYSPKQGRPLPCQVVNLSAGGALIRSGSECPSDEPLILHVDGFGSFEGVVVRSAGGATGFKFLMGELKRDRLKHALASFAKNGVAPTGTYGIHPNFKPGSARPRKPVLVNVEDEPDPRFPFA